MDAQLARVLADLKANRLTKAEAKALLSRGFGTRPDGVVRFHPVWQEADTAPADHDLGHVALVVAASSVADALRARGVAASRLTSPAAGLAERYTDLAVQVLDAVRDLLTDPASPRVLVQLVAPADGEDAVLSGLSAVLRTAAEENPRIVAQLVLVDADPETAADQALAASRRAGDRAVRFGAQVRTWAELPPVTEVPLPWKEGGVYVVTGGLGGLALLVARDLLASVRGATLLLVGRSPLDAAKARVLDGLRTPNSVVRYSSLDVADGAAVTAFLADARREFGAVHGIVHSAGVLHDSLILTKTADEVRRVFAPKVAGAVNLDRACGELPLDFFALFSSVAAVTGNVGQADYAAANAFLDAFAAHRTRLVAEGTRSGRTLSVNWPLWAEGGMSVDEPTRRAMWERAGMAPMGTAAGLGALHACLADGHSQVMVVEGDRDRIRAFVQGSARTVLPEPAPVAAPAVDAGLLREKVVHKLKRLFGAVIGLAASKVDAEAPLTSYGVDSVVVTRLNGKLAETFAHLSKALLYEYRTLDALADHLVRAHHDTCLTWTGLTAVAEPVAEPVIENPVVVAPRPAVAPAPLPDSGAVAVVGMSGRFPQAADLDEYWRNLAAGRDCVTEIPADRWSEDGFFHPDRDEAVERGLSYGKWGGFLDGAYDFDPLFFGISPHDAMNMDPQERLFLQETWRAIEDAGYTRPRLADPATGRVGVFAGISKTGFDLHGPALWERGEKLHPLTSFGSTANRVSYVLDLHGPSLPVDTMCSSSLTAIHEAMEHLRRGECDMALAGGVNLYLHPSNYILMSAKRMLADDGRCRAFGAGGTGFVPGEGVAVLVLKRLADAERDGDHIHAVLRGSSVNHGGRTNGYTVPSPAAQADVVRAALERAGVAADAVGYLEAHGTGTSLGDPVEVDGLTQAFGGTGDCALGSAKSTIGHLEAAAGVAGLIKVVLQLRHGKLAPTLHADEVNPNIDFDRTPFRLQRELADWTPKVGQDGVELPRVAGVSSFGAGGANAHVVVEEYRPVAREIPAVDGPALIVLSARDGERLLDRARDLLGWLERRDPAAVDLAAVARTLQTGREAMAARLAFTAVSSAELAAKLTAFVTGDEHEDLHVGDVARHRDALAGFAADVDMAETVAAWVAKGKFDKLLDLWVKGFALDWARLSTASTPPVSLPGYPFARERLWVGDLTSGAGRTTSARLHPLVHTNTSNLDAQRFTSVFTGDEFFLRDHVVKGERVLPGVAYLEMARAALAASVDDDVPAVVLRNVVWARPVTVGDQPAHVRTTLVAERSGEVSFEVSSLSDQAEPVVHSRGTVAPTERDAATLDLAALRAACADEVLDAEWCYATYRALGLDYGRGHRGVESVALGAGQALARLRLPESVADTLGGFVLHPSLLDAALQATVGLLRPEADSPLHLPFALDELTVLGDCASAMWAWLRPSADDRPESAVRKLDLDLCDDDGVVRARLRGFSARAYDTTARPVASPVVVPAVRPAPTGDGLAERTSRYLVTLLAAELRMSADRVDADAALDLYGIDSIMTMNLTAKLEQVFGSLPKTLFFEHQTIRELAGYFVDAQAPKLAELLGSPAQTPRLPESRPRTVPARRGRAQVTARPASTDVAIIGVAGRYPGARDVTEFWANLVAGKDCVTEIPADRWDHGRYFDADKDAPGKTYAKWGGFLDGLDRFDPLFFGISPREAEFMDPQERLFLECVHETLEDAGYTRDALAGHRDHGMDGAVGVFVGVMYEEYQLYGAQEQQKGRNLTLSGSASSIANRVSYIFNLHGPSLAVDTMCSSSLTALHLACQSLRHGWLRGGRGRRGEPVAAPEQVPHARQREVRLQHGPVRELR